MAENIERFDVALKGKTMVESYKALREFFRKDAEASGRTLGPSWDQTDEELEAFFSKKKPKA